MKIKQNISTAVYLILSACLLGGAVYLGSNYISDNTADINTDVIETDRAVSTDDFTETETPLPVIAEIVYETDDRTVEPETEDRLSSLIESLYVLFEEDAPLRWEEYDDVDWSRVRLDRIAEAESETETAETQPSADTSVPETEGPPPEFVRIYPKLAYFYKDLESGRTISYNADEILYSASLIKAPYIYSVVEEIDAFVSSKLPPEETAETEETETAVSESEAAYETDIPAETAIPEDNADTEEIAETDAEPEETVDIWQSIEYTPWELKYDLGEIWTYDPETMYQEGSGELLDMPAGTQLTWMELFDYTLLYSDNVAFAQIRERFGYSSFYKKVAELGIAGTESGFMNLSARDCGIFLEAMYEYFGTGSFLAEHTRDTMADSKKLNLIASHYPDGTAAHKYGWDLDAFHDMAIIYDEHPYIIVIMTDYEDGGQAPTQFFADVVALTKEIHAELHRDDAETAETEETVSAESVIQ